MKNNFFIFIFLYFFCVNSVFLQTAAMAVVPKIANDSKYSNLLDYFKDSYEDSDKNFNEIFARIKAVNPNAEVFNFLYDEGNIKSYYIPPSEEMKNLVVLISGTHGIEAFAGSAVQRQWLDHQYQGVNTQNTGILMIHGFNLWGFQHQRRVNEKNIDLNRSFILDRNRFRPDDTAYSGLNDFLNPRSAASPGLFSHAAFICKALYNIAVHSMESLRSSILRGQYTFAKGIFYGGKNPQPQELMIEQLIDRYFKPYKKVMLIDLHTGYGARGKLHLLAGKMLDENSIKLKNIFGDDQIDFADKKKFYAVEGEMSAFFKEKIKQKTGADVSFVIFEYGTLDSQNALGSIESLRRMVLENQNFYHPAYSEDDSNRIKELYREMFYPSDPEWRESIIQQSNQRLQKVFK